MKAKRSKNPNRSLWTLRKVTNLTKLPSSKRHLKRQWNQHLGFLVISGVRNEIAVFDMNLEKSTTWFHKLVQPNGERKFFERNVTNLCCNIVGVHLNFLKKSSSTINKLPVGVLLGIRKLGFGKWIQWGGVNLDWVMRIFYL